MATKDESNNMNNSIGSDSVSKHNYATFEVFDETMDITRHLIQEQVWRGGYDVIIEIGCSTGNIIGKLNTKKNIPRYGLDKNKEKIDYCIERYNINKNQDNNETNSNHCQFHVLDAALNLADWWETEVNNINKNGCSSMNGNSNGNNDKKFCKPLIYCANNALTRIQPQYHRTWIIQQMLKVAGTKGFCMASYWDGNFFSHAILNYYHVNTRLCGEFSVLHDDHIDWNRRRLTIDTPEINYSTVWHTPSEVQLILRSMDIDVSTTAKSGVPIWGKPHMYRKGLAIFIWFDHTSTSNAKVYFDNDNIQNFYSSKIWRHEEPCLHIGRYDLILSDEVESLTNVQRVTRAQELHELEFVKLIKTKTSQSGGGGGLRVVDMGCGYGGLLRRLWKERIIWSGVGVDISHRMCESARRLNIAAKISPTTICAADDIEILEQSYLDTSLGDESTDLVVSMDSLVHIGLERQRRIMAEAARILRPGGWIIFTDIMQSEVDGKLRVTDEMEPIYKRVNHSMKLGSVSNYQKSLQKCGFSQFHFEHMPSDNISQHYGILLEIIREKGATEIGITDEFKTRLEDECNVWTSETSNNNISWGIIVAQKTQKVKLRGMNGKV